MSEEGARIDVWLWRARFFKSRALAAQAAAEGRIRLTRGVQSAAVAKASARVRPGDGLTLWFDGALRTVSIVALGARRGPAAEARALYAESGGGRAGAPSSALDENSDGDDDAR
ncbi:MAG: RNA-binding S4 domain-containing protein [Hyphomonadaceae bacterium]